MKQVLHYLKFDFLRWRWLVVTLWGLVALHSVLFLTAELRNEPEWVDWRDRGWRSESLFSETVVVLANGILVWALALLVLAGAADSPVRRRTWLLTRAGDRWLRVMSRLVFLFLAVLLPLAAGYAVMPLAAGFDALTVLHSFSLALKVTAPLAALLWLWVRAWPHVPGLLVGALCMISPWMIAYAAGLRPPGEWFAILPSLPVVAFCLALPALVCLGAAGKLGRQAAMHGWIAGVFLPVMGVASGVVSHGLRTVFPGRLERVVFGTGRDWKAEPVSDIPLSHESFLIRSDAPFRSRSADGGSSAPAVSNVRILATSWQRKGDQSWSGWREASGEIQNRIQNRNEGLELRLSSFDREGLSGEEHLTLRLKALVRLTETKLQVLPPDAGTKATGHGWIYESAEQEAVLWRSLFERGRVVPGMGIAFIEASRGPTSESSWFPAAGDYYPPDPMRLPGYHFANREWEGKALVNDSEEAIRFALEPVQLMVTDVETCVRIVRLESVRVVIEKPVALPSRTPRARAVPSKEPEEVEPFTGYVPTIVWPPDQALPVPVAGAAPHEVAYFIHWLKGRKTIPEPQQAAALVPVWWKQFLEIAALERLHPRNALLQVLAEGLPAEHRGDLLVLLQKASWLVLVVEQRGWQAEAKPFLLESARRTGFILDDFIPLVRGYRDPAFNKWMRYAFKFDQPTALYWESMPELAAELPGRLKKGRNRGAGWSQQECDVLLFAGSRDYLTELLEDLSGKSVWRKNSAAALLYRSVLNAAGNSPPSPSLILLKDGRADQSRNQRVSPEFLQWFAGLGADDFTFDREQRRFIRKSTAPKAP